MYKPALGTALRRTIVGTEFSIERKYHLFSDDTHHSQAVKLYFKNTLLGEINNISVEGNWLNGHFTSFELEKEIKDFLDFMVDEDRNFEDPPFNEYLLNESNWWLVDKDGTQIGIEIPALYPDGFITWRKQ